MVISSIQYSLIICINESPCLWIIIPAVQIIKPALGIIVVSAVAEGVLLPDGARQAPCAGCRVPDLIIRDAFPVIGSQLVLPAGIPIGIVLHMAGAVYGFRHLIHQGRGRPVCIVQEPVSGLVVCPQVHRPAAHAPKAIISVAQDLVPVKFFA